MITLNKNLATRLSAQRLFEDLVKNNQKEIDFSLVEVVSRSFANEFCNLEKSNDFRVEKLNLSEDLKKMFDTALFEIDSDLLKKSDYKSVSVEKYANLI